MNAMMKKRPGLLPAAVYLAVWLFCVGWFWLGRDGGGWIMAYTRQGGSRTFTELLKSAGLDSPFEESCLRGVCQAASDWLDGYDLSGIK